MTEKLLTGYKASKPDQIIIGQNAKFGINKLRDDSDTNIQRLPVGYYKSIYTIYTNNLQIYHIYRKHRL